VIAGNKEDMPKPFQEHLKRPAQHLRLMTHIPRHNERIGCVAVPRQLLELPAIVAEIRVNI